MGNHSSKGKKRVSEKVASKKQSWNGWQNCQFETDVDFALRNNNAQRTRPNTGLLGEQSKLQVEWADACPLRKTFYHKNGDRQLVVDGCQT
jgi:hypothetical protein